MLKIRSPIQTVLKPDFLDAGEAFYERITGNYALLGSYVNDADLMHVVTEPPQVFVMGGGMSSVFTSNDTENIQISKINVINNLINRILISADNPLTYQDSVYITSVLHSLGIRDERRFMKEVYHLTQKTQALNNAIDLYWNNLNELTAFVNNYIDSEGEALRSEYETLQQNILHLHEDIN